MVGIMKKNEVADSFVPTYSRYRILLLKVRTAIDVRYTMAQYFRRLYVFWSRKLRVHSHNHSPKKLNSRKAESSNTHGTSVTCENPFEIENPRKESLSTHKGILQLQILVN